MQRRIWRIVLLVAAVILLAGCAGEGPKLPAVGGTGAGGTQWNYHYALEKPRAMLPGASQRVSLGIHGDSSAPKPPEIVSAHSKQASVAEVTDVGTDSIRIRANSAGDAELAVELADGSNPETAPARVYRKPSRATIRRTTWCGDRGPVVRGVPFPVDIEATHTDETLPLLLAHPARHVRRRPAKGVKLEEGLGNVATWFVASSEAPDRIALVSRYVDSSVAFDVVSPGAIDALATGPHSPESERGPYRDGDVVRASIPVDRDEPLLYPMVPMVDDASACGRFRPTIVNDTPETCSVDIVPRSELGSYSTPRLALRSNRPGRCRFSLTFDDADGGDGLTIRYRLASE